MSDHFLDVTQPLDTVQRKLKIVDLGDGTYAVAASIAGLINFRYDQIELSYTSGNLTGVVYKLNGDTIATLTLTYTGSQVIGVVRS